MAATERAVTIIDFDAAPAEEGARRVERAGKTIIDTNRNVANETNRSSVEQAKSYERSARATEMAAAAMRSAQSAIQSTANVTASAVQAGAALARNYDTVSAAINIARRNYAGLATDVAEISEKQSAAAQSASVLARALAALGLALGTRQYLEYVDGMALLNARIGIVTKSTNEFLTAQRAVYTIAQQAGQPVQAIGELYTRVGDSLTSLGVKQAEALRFTEAVSKAMTIGGGAAASQQAALFQLSQAMGGATVQAEEWNSVIDGGPRLAKAAAEGLGLTTQAMKEFIKEGKLTPKILLDAVLSQLEKMDEEFAKLPKTVSRHMTDLNNAVMAAMAQLDKSAGISSTIGALVNDMVKRLEDPAFLAQVGAILNRLGAYAKVAADAIGFLMDNLDGAMLAFAALSGAKGILLAVSAMNTFSLGTKAMGASLAALNVTATTTQTTIAGLGAAFALTNPIAAAISILSAAGVAYLALADHSDAAGRAVDASNRSIDATRATNADAARSLEDLAAGYAKADAAARALEKTNLERAARAAQEAIDAQRDVVRSAMDAAGGAGAMRRGDLLAAGATVEQVRQIGAAIRAFKTDAAPTAETFSALHLQLKAFGESIGLTNEPFQKMLEQLAESAGAAAAAQERMDKANLSLQVLANVTAGATGPTAGLSAEQLQLANRLGLVGQAANDTAKSVSEAVASMSKSLSATGGDLSREIERAQSQLKTVQTGGIRAWENIRREQSAADEAQRRWNAARADLAKDVRASIPEQLDDALKSDNMTIRLEAQRLQDQVKTLADTRNQIDLTVDKMREGARKSASSAKTEAGQVEKNERLVDVLRREADAREQSERAMAVEAATRRLNAKATENERKEVEKLAGELYDLKAARDQEARLADAVARRTAVGMSDAARDAYLANIRITSDATRKFGETVEGTAAHTAKQTWIDAEKNIVAADISAREAERVFQDIERISQDIGSDISENLWDQITGEAKATSVLDFFKNLFKRIAVEALNQRIVMPIVTTAVGSMPGLFGIQSPANQNAQSGGMGGVGDYLSLGSKFMPSSWMNGALNGAASALGIGGASIAAQGAAASTIAEVAAADVMAAWGAGGTGVAAGSGASAGAASTLAAGAGDAAMAAGGGLTAGGATLASVLGPAAAGFGIGMLPGMFGANKATSAGIGALGGAGAGFLIGGPVGALIGGGAGLLGGIFGGAGKPSVGPNSRSTVDFSGGAFRTGVSASDNGGNEGAARALTDQISVVLNGIITQAGLKNAYDLKTIGAANIMEKDGKYVTEVNGQKKEFGDQNSAASGLMNDILQKFIKDGATDFVKKDNPQIVENLRKALDASYGKPAEELVANMQLAATDFTKFFDGMAKAQPDQAAQEMQAAAQSFLMTRDAAEKLKLNIDGLAESFKAGADRALDAQIRTAEGLTGTNSAQVIRASFQTNATALLAAGQDAMKAQVLYGAQMSALVNSFGMGIDALKQLNAMARDLETEDPVAALFARTRAEQVRAAVTEDLTLRQMAAQVQLGQVSQEAYDMAALELQQKRELAGITDESALAMLRQTQATERQALASQQAAKAAQAAAEAQKAFASASSSTRSYLLSLMTGEAGGLSAQDRYRNAQGEYASASAAIGPQATAEQLTRQTEAAKALLDASRAMNGSTTAYFRDLSSVTADLAKSAQLTPDDPVVVAINSLKSSIDGLGGKIDVQVSVDAINFVRGEIEQTIQTYVSYDGLTPREIQLANGILDAVNQSVTVALSPATGLTARELQLYQGALSNLDQSITAIVDTSGLTGANREIALGQLSDATRTINAALGSFPDLTAVEREFVLGTSRDFARVFNAFTGAAPNLTAVQQGILFGISDSFTKTYQQAVGVMPSMTADQQAILMGVSDSFTRTFQAAASAAPTLSADQLAILKGKTDDFTRTFIAATNDLVLTEDEKAVLAAKDATIRQTVDQFVNRDVTETVSTTVMRDLSSGFQASSLQAASMIIRQLDELGRLVLSGSVNVVRAVTGNYAWGEGELATVLNRAKPTVLSTGAANYIARYADIADAYMRDPTFDPERHYNTTGWKEGRIWEANQSGGIVGSYEGGGIVGNGVRGVDSVLARYAGGGYIHLAGEEGVLTADATSAIGGAGTVDYINRNRALPTMRPVVMPAANGNRASSNGELVSELRALREEVATLRRENSNMIQKQALMEDAGLKAQTAALATVLSRKSKQAASAA